MNYKGIELSCTQQELDDFITTIKIESKICDFEEKYNNVTIENPTGITGAKYYILDINGTVFLQNHSPFEQGFVAITEENAQSIIDTQKQQIIDNMIIAKFSIQNTVEQQKPQTLEEYKEAKIKELSQSCQTTIIGGFSSTAYQSIDKIYDSTLEDQANITGNALSAVSKVANVPGCENDKFYYHARGEEFVEWQATECLQLARDFKLFKEQQLIKNKQLQAYINTLTTVEEVQSVTWDTVIPT